MSEVMDVLNAFGTPLKLAWVAWIAWGVGQYFWFRHQRSMPTRKVTSVARPAPKKPAVTKTVEAQVTDAPVVGRLITPSHVTAAPKPSAPVIPQVQPEPAADRSPMPMPVAMPMAVAAVEETSSGPYTLREFESQRASDREFAAATTERPVAIQEGHTTSPGFDPSKAVAAFDPSNAVIEQFGAASDDVLDKFVRDFEMQDARPRRRKTTRLPETHSYGAEAPQVP